MKGPFSQISDILSYQSKEYTLIPLLKDYDIFDPRDYKLRNKQYRGDCLKGWHVTYLLLSDRLFLQKLTVIGQAQKFREVKGVSPEIQYFNSYKEAGQATYEFEDFRLDFNGDLYVGCTSEGALCFIDSSSVFDTYKKFSFANGECIEEQAGIKPTSIQKHGERKIKFNSKRII